MVDVKDVLRLTKSFSNQIDCVIFSNLVDNTCECTIILEDKVSSKPVLENPRLVDVANTIISKFHACLFPGKNKYALTLIFHVQL